MFMISNPTLVSAWGDNSGLPNGRPDYTMKQIDEGILGDTITFNSISDNISLGSGKNGNEKTFVAAREYTDTDASHKFQAAYLEVQDGKEYVIRIYVHNNSPRGRNAVAEDTRVFFNVPNKTAKTIKVTGFLTSSNASPTEYWDHVELISETAFHLEYIWGSAILSGNVLGEDNSVEGTKKTRLGDEIVRDTDGVLIGTDALNGRIPGCFPYTQIVTIRVKAVYDYCSVESKVRLAGNKDEDWKNEIDAKVGNTVEHLITYTNTSGNTQENVILQNCIPTDLDYVEGSAKIINSNYPDGKEIPDNIAATDNINIGAYFTGASGSIYYKTRIKSKNLVDGTNSLKISGSISVSDREFSDTTTVTVQYPIILVLFSIFVILASIMITCFVFMVLLSRKIKRLNMP